MRGLIFTATFVFLLSTILKTSSSNAQTVPGDPPARFLKKKYETINGYKMAYVEVGKGDPIVFLHGNPTSSYLWRNVMPHLEGQGRLIAPDLIGMGSSDKLPPNDPSRYIFYQHSNFLFTLLERLGVKENITFVIHDWGSALGFWWAFLNRNNPNAVKGIAFMEAIVTPLVSGSVDIDSEVASTLGRLRGPDGEQFVLQDNFFIESVLPALIIRNLTEAEMDVYRAPYLNPGEDRRPTLTWPRQISINGVPEDVTSVVRSYGDWLKTSESLPKLFINAEPGAILVGDIADIVREWPNLEEVTVPGLHYVQEDSPDLIGKTVSEWLRRI